ncbi:MAG: flagella basal body P-ring formation protein FlgA, partial [Desulfobacteraceae bacterium]
MGEKMRILYHLPIHLCSACRKGFFIVIFFGWICASASGSPAIPEVPAGRNSSTVIIHLQPSAEIIGSGILLRDIAVIRPDGPLAEELGSMRIARSPRPGMKRLLPKAKIFYSLNTRKEQHPGIVLKGPDFIQIHRAYQPIPDEYLRQVIRNYIDRKIPNADFKLGTIKFHGKNCFPVGKLKASVTRHHSDDLLGNVKFVLSVTVDEQSAVHAYVSSWVDRYEDAVFTKHALSRNALIAEKDLYMRKMNLSRAPDNICRSFEDALGKRVKQRVQAETFLRISSLETPPTIYKGDRVEIVAG